MNLPLTFDGISYNELNAGSGHIKLGSNQGASRVLVCAWADAMKLGMRLRGWRQLTPNLWTPTTPALHPFGTGLFVTDVDIQPMGQPSGENTWPWAKLTVEYKTLLQNIYIGPAQQPSYDLLDESIDFSADLVSLGKAGWTYDDDGSAVQQDVQVLVPQISYTVTQYHVTVFPGVAVYSLLNQLNNATFRGVPAGYVLYLGAQASRKVVGNLSNVWYMDWTVTHKFLIGSRDLRAETNPRTGVVTPITGQGSIRKYTSGNFNALGLGNIY